jgi:catechol 2,3-dioxygenase-like lactoylglutathione lyase family enzyme
MFRVNHIHLKAPNPKRTAQWYVDMFGAKVVGEGQGLGGSQTVRLDIDGLRINVTSAPAGQTLPEGTAEPHYGLEHFGFDTDDIEGVTARLQAHGTEVLLPITTIPSGVKIAYLKGPDNVRIELVQAAA